MKRLSFTVHCVSILIWIRLSSILNLCWKLHIRTLKYFKIRGALPPDPSRRRRLESPLLIQSVTLFKPAGYCNIYWNTCICGLKGSSFLFLVSDHFIFLIGEAILWQVQKVDHTWGQSWGGILQLESVAIPRVHCTVYLSFTVRSCMGSGWRWTNATKCNYL